MEPADCMSECVTQNDTSLVYFGEKFVSFRSLLKRYNFLRSVLNPTATTATTYFWTVEASDFPAFRGNVTADGINNSGTSNYTNNTLLNYLAPAFLATRGSIRYKVVSKQDNTASFAGTLQVTRGVGSAPTNTLTAKITTSPDLYATQAAGFPTNYSTLNAKALTLLPIQPVLEYELPYYRNYRFNVAKDPFVKGDYSPVNADSHLLSVDNCRVSSTLFHFLDVYVSVGEVFQLMLYQGPPLIKEFVVL